jgi:hypothetical protein
MSRITATNVDLDDINDFIEEYFEEQLNDWTNLEHCIEMDDDLFAIESESKCEDFISTLFGYDKSSGVESFDDWTDKYINVDNISARLLRDIMIFNLRDDSEDEHGMIKPIRQIVNNYGYRFVRSNVDDIFLDKFISVITEKKKEGSRSASQP